MNQISFKVFSDGGGEGKDEFHFLFPFVKIWIFMSSDLDSVS